MEAIVPNLKLRIYIAILSRPICVSKQERTLVSHIKYSYVIPKAFRIENYKSTLMLHLPKILALLNVKNLLPINRKKVQRLEKEPDSSRPSLEL